MLCRKRLVALVAQPLTGMSILRVNRVAIRLAQAQQSLALFELRKKEEKTTMQDCKLQLKSEAGLLMGQLLFLFLSFGTVRGS